MEQRLILHCVDTDSRVRAELARVIFALGHHAEVYSSISELCHRPPREGLLLVRDDPRDGGFLAASELMADRGMWLPAIVTDYSPSTNRIVAAMKAGALDYLTLPIDPQRLGATLKKIGGEARREAALRRRKAEARGRIAQLSNREREVLDWLSEGSSNKAIARHLDISPRTVEIHRANMMHKLGARHAAEAVRLRMEAQIEPPVAY
jgi:FixJ family two-component response regulator